MKIAIWIFSTLFIGGVLSVIFISSAVSCRDESTRPTFIRVQKAISDEDPQVGLTELKNFLKKNPDSAQAHLMLANLYDERLNMPLEAIFSYRQYLELNPSANRDEVERWITANKKRCFIEWNKEFRDAAITDQTQEFINLRNENRELRYQLEEIERLEIAVPLNSAPEKPVAVKSENDNSTAIADTPPLPRSDTSDADFYVVQRGDSLGKISKKIYGDARYHKNLYEFNRDTLKSPNDLKPGQKLKLPPLTKLPEIKEKVVKNPILSPLPPIQPLNEEQLKKIRGESKQNNAETAKTPVKKVTSAAGTDSTIRSTSQITPYLYE